MIKFFRHIRHRLLSEGKTTKYFKYAIGEIILVVIGILIALSINNWNEGRKERIKEINYLENLKIDLLNEIKNSEHFATNHFEKANSCAILLNSEAPNTIKDVQVYTDRFEMVFMWFSFVPNNNTFKELLSSGNLSLIKNDSIKNGLLELDKFYANISTSEDHMRREYEEFLYDINVKNISSLSFFDMSKATYGLPDRLKAKDIPEPLHIKLIEDAQWQHNNDIFRNGLKLALMNNSYISGLHKNLGEYIQEILKLIDQEIQK